MATETIDLDRGYRPKEACEFLGIKRSTFWQYVKAKKLKTRKLSARVTIVQGREIVKLLSGVEDEK